MTGTIYGYVRVSTDRQDGGSDTQRRALLTAGCHKIIEEMASGRKPRPALARLVRRLAPGDVLTVTRYDRISRSVADFYRIGQQISARGATLRSLAEQFDTGTPVGKAMMGIAAVWAQLEAETTSERVRAGLAAARARGKRLGRPPRLSEKDVGQIVMAVTDGLGTRATARLYGVSPSTIRRAISRFKTAR